MEPQMINLDSWEPQMINLDSCKGPYKIWKQKTTLFVVNTFPALNKVSKLLRLQPSPEMICEESQDHAMSTISYRPSNI